MEYPTIIPQSGDIIYDIPFPYRQFVDTQFILSDVKQGYSLFIPDDCYQRIDDYRIAIPSNNNIGIDENSKIRFTFIHNKNRRWVGKVEYHLKVKEVGQTVFNLPSSPYNQLVNIKKRMYVFYNRKRQTQGLHYRVHDELGRIEFINRRLKHLIDDRVDILIVYSFSHHNNGAIQELPQSGYIYLSKYEIDRNFNPNLMAVFVDGKLVDKKDILQMTNTIYKIQNDIGSRYNLDVRNLSPRVNSMVTYYQQHYHSRTPRYHFSNIDIYNRINVDVKHYGRRCLKPLFNPIYFYPDLIQNPDLWINLILLRNTVDYELKFYGNDTNSDAEEYINVVMQVRPETFRTFDKNSMTCTLAGKFPGVINPYNRFLEESKIIFSIQVSQVLELDIKEPGSFDCIIGRMQADLTKYDETDPLYYTLESNGFDLLTEVKIFRWSVSSEKNNMGIITWEQDINLEPDNKKELLKERE